MRKKLAVFDLAFLQQERPCENEIHSVESSVESSSASFFRYRENVTKCTSENI